MTAADTPIIPSTPLRGNSSATTEEISLNIDGMTCASCVAHVEKAARSVPGVVDSRVNLARGIASITFDASRTDAGHIADAISDSGYTASVAQAGIAPGEQEQQRMQRRKTAERGWFWRAAVGIALWLPLELTHWTMQLAGHANHAIAAEATWMGWATLLASSIAMIYVGGRFYASALGALRHATSNMDTLISMGASVAFGYSLVYFVGGMMKVWPPPVLHDLFFMEASGLLALISLGHWMESRARQSAGSAIHALLELAPSTAWLLAEGSDAAAEAAVASLNVGDRLMVRPGDRVPIDAVVLAGESSVDESMISGEPIPVERKPGDAVIGGTINQDGRLIVRVAKTGSRTALAQIVSFVERAQSTKPPVQRLADQISAIFVPSVLAIAIVTGVGWYLWGRHGGWPAGQIWAQVARAVCSVLIIACPCALGLAVPATVMVSTGMGAHRGILIRDVDAIQKAEKIDIVVLDKTGTITLGKPTVSEVICDDGLDADEVLRLAASAEQFSSHPLAKAVVNEARRRGMKLSDPDSFTSTAGGGVVAGIGGATVLAGSDAFLQSHDIPSSVAELPASAVGGTLVHVAKKDVGCTNRRLGAIVIADQIKPDSISAIATLRRMNLRVVMLSGDNRAAALAVAKRVGIDDVRAEVKPAEKAQVIRELQKTGRVAMVGDGINDAPALAAANLGIAVGGGSDIASEAGDIVLISGSLHGVATVINLSRATMRKVRQNLFLAFIYNVIAIPLAAFGFLSPLIAAGAMALSDVTVIGNALLLRGSRVDSKRAGHATQP